MSIKFAELNRDSPAKTKEQILADTTRFLAMNKAHAYFYDGQLRGEQAHYSLTPRDEDFDDVPF